MSLRPYPLRLSSARNSESESLKIGLVSSMRVQGSAMSAA